jgi:hypothetical protein
MRQSSRKEIESTLSVVLSLVMWLADPVNPFVRGALWVVIALLLSDILIRTPVHIVWRIVFVAALLCVVGVTAFRTWPLPKEESTTAPAVVPAATPAEIASEVKKVVLTPPTAREIADEMEKRRRPGESVPLLVLVPELPPNPAVPFPASFQIRNTKELIAVGSRCAVKTLVTKDPATRVSNTVLAVLQPYIQSIPIGGNAKVVCNAPQGGIFSTAIDSAFGPHKPAITLEAEIVVGLSFSLPNAQRQARDFTFKFARESETKARWDQVVTR